jgi:hypothetical protein
MRNFVPDEKSLKNELQFKTLSAIQKNLVLWDDNKYNCWKNTDIESKDRNAS